MSNTNKLEIEIIHSNYCDNIEIQTYDTVHLDVVTTERILVSDLPDDIPMSKIIGNLSCTRIDDLEDCLNEYISGGNVHVENLIWGINNKGLSGYLDQYYFDCGTPNSD